MDRITIELRNDTKELARLHAAVEQFGRAHGWSDHVRDDMLLALEECVTNVMKYAYRHAGRPAAEHRIAVQLESRGEQALAVIEDYGAPFDPLSQPPPDLDVPLEDMPVGGLGIHLVRQVMDHVEYRRQDGRNHMLLMKNLTTQPS